MASSLGGDFVGLVSFSGSQSKAKNVKPKKRGLQNVPQAQIAALGSTPAPD